MLTVGLVTTMYNNIMIMMRTADDRGDAAASLGVSALIPSPLCLLPDTIPSQSPP